MTVFDGPGKVLGCRSGRTGLPPVRDAEAIHEAHSETPIEMARGMLMTVAALNELPARGMHPALSAVLSDAAEPIREG